MSDLEEEAPPVTEAPLVRKGRPTGRSDATQRKRRTAQEISDDKIRVAQMKLDALRETEKDKLANRKPRRQPVERRTFQPKPVATQSPDSDSGSDPPNPRTGRQALYDSWFK